MGLGQAEQGQVGFMANAFAPAGGELDGGATGDDHGGGVAALLG